MRTIDPSLLSKSEDERYPSMNQSLALDGHCRTFTLMLSRRLSEEAERKLGMLAIFLSSVIFVLLSGVDM